MRCLLPPEGWACTREPGHDGPCAAIPVGRKAYTHKGWFGLCPVYMRDTYEECVVLAPRHELFVPLFWVSQMRQAAAIGLCSLIVPGYVPRWKIRVTGEMK